MTTHRLFYWITIPLVLLSGCAEIDPPTAEQILESPFGTGPLRLGMSKDEVREIWGAPDRLEPKGEDQWGAPRELWVYEKKFPGLVPVNIGYASKTKYLEFDGNNLVSFYD